MHVLTHTLANPESGFDLSESIRVQPPSRIRLDNQHSASRQCRDAGPSASFDAVQAGSR